MKQNDIGATIISFVVLFTMPLVHALMILMEHCSPRWHTLCRFRHGFVGLVMATIGVFAKGDTRQTLWGLFGGLLFWTGWVELYTFIMPGFGVKPLLDAASNIVTRPEYLIMPSSFGFWVMFMMLYIFSAKTGCDFIEWLQKVFFRNNQVRVTLHPMTRHTSIVTSVLNPMPFCGRAICCFCSVMMTTSWAITPLSRSLWLSVRSSLHSSCSNGCWKSAHGDIPSVFAISHGHRVLECRRNNRTLGLVHEDLDSSAAIRERDGHNILVVSWYSQNSDIQRQQEKEKWRCNKREPQDGTQ